METNLENKFAEPDKIKLIRRQLLPWWIKVFCWIFMIMGFFAFLFLIYGFFGGKADINIYGFYSNSPLSIIGFLLITTIIFKGFTAYSLWFEKDFALKLGKIDAIIGVLMCVFSMLILPFIEENTMFTLRLEIALLIPYYLKLDRIEYEWTNLEKQ